MKTVVFLIVFIIYFQSNESKIQVIKPDETKVRRPCDFDDMYCLRREHLVRGWCDADMLRSISVPFKTPRTVLLLPTFNMTVILKNVVVKGLENGKVGEFFINDKMNKAVKLYNFENVTVNSKTEFMYHRPATEDIVLITETSEFYESIKTTTIITGTRIVDLHKFDVHTSVSSFPKYNLNLDGLDDPDFLALFEIFESNIKAAVQESFLVRGTEFAEYFTRFICRPQKT